MDREYPREKFSHTRITGSRPDIEVCRDSKNTHGGEYCARWRGDPKLETNSLVECEHGRALSGKLKEYSVYQNESKSSALVEWIISDEQRSDVSRKLSSTSTWNDAPGSAKQTFDAPPVFEAIDQLLMPLSRNEENMSVVFELCCDIVGFVHEELAGHQNLASVLTLSGTVEKAFAPTCEDYIQLFWPDFGLRVLEQFSLTIQNSYYTEWLSFADGFSIRIISHKSREGSPIFSIQATGKIESLIEFAQMLTWMAATFRRPQYGRLSYSIPTFQKTHDARFRIGISDLEPIKEGLCWSPMFTHGVIAKSFPIPKRNDEIGLEIPFDLMVVLGRIWYPMEYLNGFVLKGHSTILIPTQKNYDSVQWHFISHEDHNKKIHMSAMKDYRGRFVEDIGLETLQTARTFVGWTQDAHIHVGAKTSGYDFIRDSKVPPSPRRPRLAREMTSGMGTSGLGFFGMQLGAKVIIPKGVFGPVKREHILLEDMLLNSRNDPILLWDAGTRRGWMIPEIAVLLMILHVWAARQTDSEALLKKIPFVEASSDAAQRCYEAIRTHRNLQLRSRADGDGEDLKFITQVENIFAAVASRKEEIIMRNNSSTRFSYSTYLKGWELTDVAHSKPWFKEKRMLLDDTCGTWPSVLAKQHEVLVLFCQGVGELIQPADNESFCQTWKTVPKDHSYLAASVACISNLDIHCQLADRFKGCCFNYKNCPSRLQELSLRPSSRSIPVLPTGAIIVGRPHHSLYQACLPNLGQLQDMTHKLCTEKDSTQETPKEQAVGNRTSLSLLNPKTETGDICPNTNDNNEVRIEGRTRMGEKEMNAC